jgi:hypothetical protein
MVFDKPFDYSKLRDVFFELVEEAGIDRAKARLEFEAETPRAFPASGALDADHYVEQGTNWVKRGKDFKGVVLWLRVFTRNAGTPTVLQAGLPGGSWDGSSCFNFMKELVSRCCCGPHGDVFQGKRLTLRLRRECLTRACSLRPFSAFPATSPSTRGASFGTWPARPACLGEAA